MLLATGETRSNFADLDVPIWAWFALLGVIGVMLAVDLFRHRDDHEPTASEALTESAIWVLCGLAFAGVMLVAFGGAAFGAPRHPNWARTGESSFGSQGDQGHAFTLEHFH